MRINSKDKHYFLYFSSIATIALLILLSGKASVVITYIFLGFILYSICEKQNNLNILFYYTIGVIVAILFYEYWDYFYGNPYFLGRESDDHSYDVRWTEGFVERYGVNLFKIPEHLNTIERGLGILHNSRGYVAFIIILQWLSSFLDGYHSMIPRISNIFFLTLIAYYGSKIAFFYTKNVEVQKNTMFFIFFFPVMIFNSVHVFRDTIVSFIITYIYYRLLLKKYSFISILSIFILLFILFFFRTSSLVVTLFMILLLLIDPKKINIKLVLGLFMFIIIGYFVMQDSVNTLIRQIVAYQQFNVERFGGIGSRIFNLPILIGFVPRIIYLIFTPVPNFSGFHQIFVSLSAFIQIFTFPFLFLSFVDKNIDLKLKLTFLIFFIGIALSSATFRHVMMYIPFGIILTILLYFYRKQQRVLFKYYLPISFALISAFIISITIALIY